MKVENLEKRGDLRNLLYHLREVIEIQERLTGLVEDLAGSLGTDEDRAQTVMGKLETELYFHLPYHLQELREPFERVLKEVFGEEARILVDREKSSEESDVRPR